MSGENSQDDNRSTASEHVEAASVMESMIDYDILADKVAAKMMASSFAKRPRMDSDFGKLFSPLVGLRSHGPGSLGTLPCVLPAVTTPAFLLCL